MSLSLEYATNEVARTWVRPIRRVELPLSLLRPVEKVNDDEVDGQTPSFVFSSHFKQLLLRLVSKLALPETKTVLGHHRNFTRCLGISLFNLCGRVAHHNPVVHHLR